MIIVGKGKSMLARFITPKIKCNNCNEVQEHEIIATGSYIRIFWIPTFPFRKKVVAECENCLYETPKKNFSLKLQDAYNDNELLVKRPWWHWIGSIILVLFIFLIASLIEQDSKREKSKEEISLELDKDRLTNTPTFEKDSLAFDLKYHIEKNGNSPLSPAYFDYATAQKGDKLLVLLSIRDFKKLTQPEKMSYVTLIQEFIENKDLDIKSRYIGIYGRAFLVLSSTPKGTETGLIVSDENLLDFYR